MNDAVEVAIVGAGPYGLSLAAHLRAAGVSFRAFGTVMHPWRTAMPAGMFLKSQGFASNLSSPDRSHTLSAFCRATGRPYADYGLPVPLDTFLAYGEWFACELVPDAEDTLVVSVEPAHGAYLVTLTTGESLVARRVVVAVGVEHFAHTPAELASLPADLCTHASAHTDLSTFSGQRVVVLGAGQSALESAALLHEQGAEVQVVMRASAPKWNGPPLPPDRALVRRLREPEAGLGSGWGTWFYSRQPGLYRHLPTSTRIYRARTALGPAGAPWLRERIEGQFPLLPGQRVRAAVPGYPGVRLRLAGTDGRERDLDADHVIAGTGYRAELARLTFLSERLRAAVRTVAGTPRVGADYQSSVPGLYFTGPAVATTFGPVMRFVYGTDHAARTMAAAAAGAAGRRRELVGAGT